jgi:hypothetical protein
MFSFGQARQGREWLDAATLSSPGIGRIGTRWVSRQSRHVTYQSGLSALGDSF